MKKYVGVTELPSELRNAADVYVSYPIVVQLMERAARVIEGMTFAATLALEAVEEIEYDNEMYCVWCGKTAPLHSGDCSRQAAKESLRAALELTR